MDRLRVNSETTNAQKVVVVGQGYVGLPLAMLAVEKGHNVVGFDVDVPRVESLQKGISFVEDISNAEVAAALASAFATDSLAVALLVLVLTPLALAVLQRSAYACALALYTFLTDTRRMTRWVIRAQRCRSSCACVLCARWCGRCADCCCTPAARGNPNRLRSGV